MSDHALAASPWWKRILTLEPAIVRGVIGALVLVLGLWGVDAADLGERGAETLVTLLGLVPFLTAWWTRSAVTPSSQVVAKQEPSGELTAGGASPFPTGLVVDPAVPVGEIAPDPNRKD